MTSNTRKLLEEYDIESAGAFDLAVVLLGYMRQTSDDESERLRVVQGVLLRWKTALEKKALPDIKAKNSMVADQLGRIMDTLESLKEDLTDEP